MKRYAEPYDPRSAHEVLLERTAARLKQQEQAEPTTQEFGDGNQVAGRLREPGRDAQLLALGTVAARHAAGFLAPHPGAGAPPGRQAVRPLHRHDPRLLLSEQATPGHQTTCPSSVALQRLPRTPRHIPALAVPT